uniref:Uncharacterized protein n=1 Tax=Caenorhabditis japonica TaxID=281687 RepID=A0A8R1I0B7_CAEJA
MGKKRKHQNGDDSAAELGKKRVKNESFNEDTTINGVNNISIDDDGRYRTFLVKKPIEVSLEDLADLKWSGDDGIVTKSKLKTGSGNYRIIAAATSGKRKKERMVHIPAIREREESDSKNIRAAAYISGAITILPQEIKQKALGGSIYEEGEEPDESALEIHPGLQKIKKTAVLELESRQQRNKAYGTTTDSAGNPRKLINILKK